MYRIKSSKENILLEAHPLIDKLARTFNVELPVRANMTEYLNVILPEIRQWSEDLREEEFWLERGWMEMRDQDDFHEAVLHFFNQKGEYMQSVDGNVSKGKWRYIEASNKLLLERGGGNTGKSELFDLAYLDEYFFILRKHGDQTRKGNAKYFVMAYEPIAASLEWRDAMELLFNKYRESSSFYKNVLIVVAIIAFLAVVFTAL